MPVTTPMMPLLSSTESLTLTADCSAAASFWRLRCGRRSKKYITTKMRMSGRSDKRPPPEDCGVSSAARTRLNMAIYATAPRELSTTRASAPHFEHARTQPRKGAPDDRAACRGHERERPCDVVQRNEP